MKKQRKKPREKPAKKSLTEGFDESLLTGSDRQLLADFERRRSLFERAIAASNIIYHKHTCPVCGLPTLNERCEYEVCVLCLWEDCGGESAPTMIAAPNYVSAVQERINVAGMIAVFEQEYAIDDSLDPVVRSIKSFEARLDAGEVKIDREDFGRHLRNVLPTRELSR